MGESLVGIKQRFKIRHLIALGLIGAAVPLAFQNCADPLNMSATTLATLNNSLPFAYDATVDTISYMSCSNSPAGYLPRSIYTFRAGAYSTNVMNPTSGLGLTADIWPYLATETTQSGRASFLQTMAQNVGASLQLSMRSLQNLQLVLTVNSGSATPNIDYWNYLSTLDSDAIVTRVGGFPVQTQRVNYFYGLSGLGSSLMEGSLYFNASETLAQSVRSSLQSGSVLSLTYTVPGSADPVAAQAVAGAPENRAYGRGYNVAFTFDTTNYTAADPRVLATMHEIDLSTGNTAGPGIGQWSCLANNRYMIVRYDDQLLEAYLGECELNSDYDQLVVANGGQPVFGNSQLTPLAQIYVNQLALIRNVLPESDWYIDVQHLCAIPKQTQFNGTNNDSCYGPIPAPSSGVGTIPIVYNVAAQTGTNNVNCGPVATNTLNANGSVAMFSNCPHYVSVCTRAVTQ
jgi:hypothetical protein